MKDNNKKFHFNLDEFIYSTLCNLLNSKWKNQEIEINIHSQASFFQNTYHTNINLRDLKSNNSSSSVVLIKIIGDQYNIKIYDNDVLLCFHENY